MNFIADELVKLLSDNGVTQNCKEVKTSENSSFVGLLVSDENLDTVIGKLYRLHQDKKIHEFKSLNLFPNNIQVVAAISNFK